MKIFPNERNIKKSTQKMVSHYSSTASQTAGLLGKRTSGRTTGDIKDEETIKHVEILDYLDNKECHIHNTQRRARSIALIPVTLGIISSLILNINAFIGERRSGEAYIHRWVNIVKKECGEKFYLRNDFPDYMKGARYIGNDKEISLKKYLHYRYNFYEYSNDILITDMTFLLLYLLIIPPFVYCIFFWQRQAPLIIDHERQIFYT
uniref:hypothetical protein n=1 Tax=Photorhabdus sp. RM322S TaxID=3342825 RepID=UPI0036DC0B10